MHLLELKELIIINTIRLEKQYDMLSDEVSKIWGRIDFETYLLWFIQKLCTIWFVVLDRLKSIELDSYILSMKIQFNMTCVTLNEMLKLASKKAIEAKININSATIPLFEAASNHYLILLRMKRTQVLLSQLLAFSLIGIFLIIGWLLIWNLFLYKVNFLRELLGLKKLGKQKPLPTKKRF
jgi:hypothetical protein